MIQGRRSSIDELFVEAIALPRPAREKFLDQACKGDSGLRRELEELLGFHDESSDFMEVPAAAELVNLPSDADDAGPAGPARVPERIGAFQIHQVLGVGGMGVVYLAESDKPRRQVALKVIKAGLVSRNLLRRFEQEAQVLALLRHPGIAQIYEAGTADAGDGPQPYFAMELVEGQTLTEYAAKGSLSVDRRLELMAAICDAVHHAHTRGVIHRDLKPGNILIDAGGQPKILDFGVARVTDSDLQMTTLQTDVGQLIGTLTYMSPEQATADPSALDTRSDVYALGVVLYELLASRLPHDLRDKPVFEAARIIRDEDHTPLSHVSRIFRGDIETIVRKALEKNPARRYQSASELAEDLRRYLRNEPIVARPPSTFYNIRKFAARHKALVGTMAAGFVAMSAGLVLFAWQANAATIARNDAIEQQTSAEEEAATAKAINEFFTDLLGSISPRRAMGKQVTVRDVLDQASPNIDTGFASRPKVRAALHFTVGSTYAALGEFKTAIRHLEASAELYRALEGPTGDRTLDARLGLAETLRVDRQHAVAEQQLLELREELEPLGPARERHLLTAVGELGTVYRDLARNDEALPLLSDAVARYEAMGLSDDLHALSTRHTLVLVYAELERYDEAERLCREVLGRQRELLTDDHPDTIASLNTLGGIYAGRGEYAEAIKYIDPCLVAAEKVFGPDHDFTQETRSNAGQLSGVLGDTRRAETLLKQVIETRMRVRGPDDIGTAGSVYVLGLFYFNQGRNAEAEPLLEEALRVYRMHLPLEHPSMLQVLNVIPTNLTQLGRPVETLEYYREALKCAEALMSPDDPKLWMHRVRLAGAMVFRGDFESAEPILKACFDHFHTAHGKAYPRTIEVAGLLTEFYAKQGKLDEAEHWDGVHAECIKAGENAAVEQR